MTRKEKLYLELLNARNRCHELKGEEIVEITDEYLNSSRFKSSASRCTISDLTNDIIFYNRRYERLVNELKINAYFATEEGKQVYDRLTARSEEINEQTHALLNMTEQKLDEVIKDWLGEDWGVRLFQQSLEIGLIERYYDEGYKKFYFGHTFEVRFGRDWGKKREPNFEFSFGCMGSFNIKDGEQDETRTKHVIGMGKFLSEQENMKALYKTLCEFSKVYDELAEEGWECEKGLKNPNIPANFMEGK